MSMNKCIFSGIVTKLEFSGTEGEKGHCARFTLMVRKSYIKDEKKKFNFVRCTAFSGTADIIKKYVKNDDYLEVDTEYITEDFVGQDGKTYYNNYFYVNRIYFASTGQNQNQQKSVQTQGMMQNSVAPQMQGSMPNPAAMQAPVPPQMQAPVPPQMQNPVPPAPDMGMPNPQMDMGMPAPMAPQMTEPMPQYGTPVPQTGYSTIPDELEAQLPWN